MNPRLLRQLGLLDDYSESYAISYTSSMTGDLDFPRLLAGKQDFWRILKLQTAVKNKKILITDRLEGVTPEKLIPIITLWKRLLDEGFEIYAWTGEITPVRNLDEIIKILPNIEDVTPEQLNSELIEKNIALDDVFIASDKRRHMLTEYLITRQVNPQYKLLDIKEDDLPQYTDTDLSNELLILNIKYEDLISLIDENHPNHQSFEYYIKQHGHIRLQSWPSADELSQLAMIPQTILDRVIEVTGTAFLPPYVSMTYENYIEVIKKLPNIRWLKYSIISQFNIEQTIDFMNHCTNLIGFEWNQYCQDTKQLIMGVNEEIWQNLEYLDLNSSSINEDYFNILIKATRRLRFLNLRKDESIRGGIIDDLEPNHLENLEYLGNDFTDIIKFKWSEKCPKLCLQSNIFLGNIEPDQIQHFINKNYLSRLCFSDVGELNHIENMTIHHLNAVEINGVQLANICNASKLITLEIMVVSLGDISQHLLPGALSQLLSLELTKADDLSGICEILNQCPSLIHLKLNNYTHQNNKFTSQLDKEALLHLQLLQITQSRGNLQSEDLAMILNHASNLKELDLSMTDISGVGTNDFDSSYFYPLNINNSIKLFKIKDTKYQIITPCVNKFPMLEELYIENVETVWEDVKFDSTMALKNLTKLVIKNTNMTNHYLAKLLDECPALEKFELIGPNKYIDRNLLKMLKPETYIRILKNDPELIEFLNDIEPIEKLPSTEHITIGKSPNNNNNTKEYMLDKPRKNPDVVQKQIFYYKPGTNQPREKYYRKDVYDRIVIDENNFKLTQRIKTFKDVPIPELNEQKNIETYYQHNENDPHLFLGKIFLEFNSNKLQPLVGLTQDDEVVGLSIWPTNAFDLFYCPDDHLYYLKLKEGSVHASCEVTYLLKTKEHPFANDMTQHINVEKQTVDKNDIEALQRIKFTEDGQYIPTDAIKKIKAYTKDERVDLLVAFISGFEDEDLDEDLDEDSDNSREIFNAIISQRRGQCRHRAIAFKALAQVLDINEVHVVTNGLHAFVEVKMGDQWITHDLGGGVPGHTTKMTLEPITHVSEDINAHIPKIPVFNRVPEEEAVRHSQYRTWDTLKTTARTYQDYAKDLIKAGKSLADGTQNVLCVLDRHQFESMHSALCQEIHEQNQQSFYINDLDDITEHSFKIDNQTGEYKAIDSPLMDFLKHAKRGDTLIINWSNFQAQHIGYNAITDMVRTIKGVAIPEGINIISLLPSGQPMGEDFYSRQRIKSICPKGMAATAKIIPTPTTNLTDKQKELPMVEFFNDHWESDLYGRIHVHGADCSFDHSALITAIEQNKDGIVLRNAPWNNEAFRLYMTEIMIKREIVVNGKAYTIPENFEFIRHDVPYAYSQVMYVIKQLKNRDDALHHHVLNRATINLFFERYHCSDKRIYEKPGLLKEYKDTILSIHVTETLSEQQWAHIFSEAQKYGVGLEILTSPQVSLPKEMHQHQSYDVYDMSLGIIPSHAVAFIEHTNDVSMIMNYMDKGVVIPVNEETTYADLIENMTIQDVQGKKVFIHESGVLAQSLLNAEPVILLKGRISTLLAKQLESLFSPNPYFYLNGERQYPMGVNLFLVTDKKPDIAAGDMNSCIYVPEHFWDTLGEQYPEVLCDKLKAVCDCYQSLTHSKHFTYIQLETMLKHLEKFPNSNPLKQILRLNKDYVKNNLQIEKAWQTYHMKVKKEVSPHKDVMEKRKDKLLAHLDASPTTFVMGSSGVGKTTFIQTELTKAYGDQLALFSGMDKIDAWVKSQKPHNILFIDEANLLAPGALDRFESLYETPPKLLINGKLVVLSDTHKVIFAGNFGHFEGRQQHRIFAEHGNIITFKELPDSFLKSKIIEPIAKDLGLADVADRFIAAYHYLNKLMPDKHPVTARNLQMMALRCFQHQRRLNNTDVAAALAIYDELSGMLNKKQRQALQQWLSENYHVDIKKAKETLKQQTTLKSDEFFITKKRLNPVRILNDLFDIRDVKIAKALHATGTSGILFEGEAGEGKSRMAVAFLKARHMLPADPSKDNSKDRYYTIAPSDPEVMKKQLTKAFHEGAVVVIDEINTIPGIEELLNALLSGYDLSGKAAQNPGFFVIGTQNPVTYMKRKPLSDALLNRFQKIDLKPYAEADLLDIKEKLIQDSKEAKQQLDEYLSAKQYARQRHLSPQPTPRDFFAGVKSEKAKVVSDHKNEQTPVPPTKVTLAQVVAMVPSIFKESAPVQVSESKLVEIYRNYHGRIAIKFHSGRAYEAFVKEMGKEVLDEMAICSSLDHSIYLDNDIIKYQQSNMPFMKNSSLTITFANSDQAKQFKSLMFADQAQIKVNQKDNTLIINEVYDKEDNPILLQHDKSKKITFNMSEKLQQLVDDVQSTLKNS